MANEKRHIWHFTVGNRRVHFTRMENEKKTANKSKHYQAKLSFGFPTRSDTNRVVQPLKIARGLNCKGFAICSENNDTEHCSFVFTYAKNRVSHLPTAFIITPENYFRNAILERVQNTSSLQFTLYMYRFKHLFKT